MPDFCQTPRRLCPAETRRTYFAGRIHCADRRRPDCHDPQLRLCRRLSQTQMSDDTLFQIASISKSVAAWGIMKLVEQGLLDLDAPVENYLSRWRLPPSEFDNRR